jgi:hypothetical protein
MKIGFIGAGKVTRTLGRHLMTAGHTIVVSNSRGPETLTDFVADLGPNAIAGTKQQAAAECEVVILATNWVNVAEALKGYSSNPQPTEGPGESALKLDLPGPLASQLHSTQSSFITSQGGPPPRPHEETAKPKEAARPPTRGAPTPAARSACRAEGPAPAAKVSGWPGGITSGK